MARRVHEGARQAVEGSTFADGRQVAGVDGYLLTSSRAWLERGVGVQGHTGDPPVVLQLDRMPIEDVRGLGNTASTSRPANAGFRAGIRVRIPATGDLCPQGVPPTSHLRVGGRGGGSHQNEANGETY